jgi:hypothetical protein
LRKENNVGKGEQGQFPDGKFNHAGAALREQRRRGLIGGSDRPGPTPSRDQLGAGGPRRRALWRSGREEKRRARIRGQWNLILETDCKDRWPGAQEKPDRPNAGPCGGGAGCLPVDHPCTGSALDCKRKGDGVSQFAALASSLHTHDWREPILIGEPFAANTMGLSSR